MLVHGYMEPSTYHPLLNISVIPQVRYKLAPLIWRRMYRADRARYTGVAPRWAARPALVAACLAAALLAARWVLGTQAQLQAQGQGQGRAQCDITTNVVVREEGGEARRGPRCRAPEQGPASAHWTRTGSRLKGTAR